MRVLTYERYGPPNVLHIAERPKPEPAPKQVRVRVRAAEITKSDVELRRGHFAVAWLWLPMRIGLGLLRPRRSMLGLYFSGEVEALGSEARALKEGDAVFGFTGFAGSAYAEYLCVPQRNLAPKPANMSFAEAAAVPLGGINALHFMDLLDVKPGEQVLVNGAGGSIGMHGVMIARSRGAEVTAVDASHKLERLRELGAGTTLDYTEPGFELPNGQFDALFNLVANCHYRDVLKPLRPRGRYATANAKLNHMLRCAITTRTSGRRAEFRFAAENWRALDSLRQLIESGQVQSIVQTTVPFEDAARGHTLVETENRVGAVVLTP